MIALRLIRKWFTDTDTEGELFVGGAHECWTLEDRARFPEEPKVPGQTAIPPGRYRMTWENSPRFGRHLLRLHGVEGFTGILIHAGNRSRDTEGCILVGQVRTDPADDWIGRSAAALAALEDRVVPRLDFEDASIEVVEEPELDQRTQEET